MKNIPYIRVGTSYYKRVKAPTIAGGFNELLVHWTQEIIRQDHGKDLISKIPKYDGFTCMPSHLNFQQEYFGFYNIYSPLSNTPIKGDFSLSIEFVSHIFGKHYELGLDYLQLLYTRPIQILPILCLVSKERSTGKSTFLKWLKKIFENNMTYLTNDSFTSQFNEDWANKLLICIDEVLFNKEELTERIKYLSTTNTNKLEAKRKDRREVEFFGKFVLCSNNETNFIKIDALETRFWVLKVPSISQELTNYLEKLTEEIPAFLHFLKHRKLHSPHKTRMWFTEQQIKTPALVKLVQNNRNRVEKELASILLGFMENYDMEEVHLCPMDALHLMNRTRVRTDLTQLRKLLKFDWCLENQKNSNKYKRLIILGDGSIGENTAKGRYFTVKKDFLIKNFDDLMTD
ncbi:primase-helicase family protein [Yeosuana marina]|uniref:primase-helicase family protein n=1 Tax=Yeosuana marina TaxID=1565536 RepID=UPI00142424BF|nr:primase-helicase family protein [Yeosuana marina]|tara:strand:- start:901 stop:2106 length:1206 start_codon:yes stop_codon:yes gene_type:complete